LTIATLVCAAAGALRGNADVLASRPFDSPVRSTAKPSNTPKPTPMSRATATSDLGAFISPLSTPTPARRTSGTLQRRAWLPLVSKPLRYDWKGIADPGRLLSATKANGFWGLNPNWYYNWGYWGPWAAAQGAQTQNTASVTSLLDAAMDDPAYVPMIWCTDDVNAGITPQQAADLARAHPGRVWLVFNEPDYNGGGDNCGFFINSHYPNIFGPGTGYYDGSHWPELGQYLAKQYIRYCDAIKAADPTARLFPFGGIWLTSASGDFGVRESKIWNGFTSYLINPTAEPNRTPRPLDGIAIHAYPIQSAGCPNIAAACLESALASTHTFYQGLATPTAPANANPPLTAGKPIWITEVGNLAPGSSPAGSPQGRSTAQAYTANVLTQPLLAWFATNAIPSGSVPYFNGIAWFSTHDCRYTNPPANTVIKDFTASDLLDIGQIPCPITSQPTTQQRTVIGQAWAAANCAACACPGPDCP
jgi:hypothetical protein